MSSKSGDNKTKDDDKIPSKSREGQFSLKIGGDKTVTVTEPTRSQFGNNLSGSFEFVLARFVYNVLSFFGSAIGSFLGGVAVEFLDRIEPSLVKYSQPLIDILLSSDELDPVLRRFLEQLQSPTDAGAAAILTGFSSQAGGMLFNSVFSALLAPVTMQINKRVRPAIPDAAAILTMFRYDKITEDGMRELMAFSGYKDELIDAFITITEQKAGIVDWVDAYYRESVTQEDLTAEATRQGVSNELLNLLISLKQQMLNITDLLNGYYRGILTETELRRELNRHGFADEWITIWLQSVKPIPPLQDIIHMSVRDAWRDDIAGQWGYDDDFQPIVAEYVSKLGFDPDWAKRYWRAHWELPSVTAAITMVHRGIISVEDFNTFLRVADYPAGWRDALTQSIYSPYTRVDVRRMYRLGVLTETEVQESYQALGYDTEKAARLTEFTVRYETDDPESKPELYKKLTTAMVEKAYRKNLITRAEYQTRLIEMDYQADEIDIIIGLADLTKVIDNTPDYFTSYQKDVTSIVERSYVRGMISSDTAHSYLTSINIPDMEADYILGAAEYAKAEAQKESQVANIHTAYVNGSIDELTAIQMLGKLGMPGGEQSQLLEDWSLEVSIHTRRLTEAQYRNAWKMNIITRAAYMTACQDLGYTDADINIMVAMYRTME